MTSPSRLGRRDSLARTSAWTGLLVCLCTVLGHCGAAETGDGSPNLRHLNRVYTPRSFATRAEWETYATWLRRNMAVGLALEPEPPRTPLHADVAGSWSGGGVRCEKVAFESLPGFYVTGNLYRPAKPAAPATRPAILCPHGHWEDGRLHDRDTRGSVVARCLRLAKLGVVVFSYDMIGYNDSCQLVHRRVPAAPHFGLSTMALQTWNSVRAVDFLLGLPEVDPERIGVTGASGGGTQTFILAAVEPRIAAAAPICMISYHMQGGCVCENAPLLRLAATSVDIGRLFAPKPMFMGSCTGDWTKNTPEVEFPAVRSIYELYGAGDRLFHQHVNAPHNYNQELRQHVYGFFSHFLLRAESAAPVDEGHLSRPPLRDRMVWWGREEPEPLSDEGLRRAWRRRCEGALRPHLRSPRAARKRLGPLLPHALGITPDSMAALKGRSPARVAVDARDGVVRVRLKPGALSVSVPRGIKFFDAYNPTAFAQCVHEILAAIDSAGRDVELWGMGEAGPACLAASALSPRVALVQVDMCGFDPDDDADWQRLMDTPCLRSVGGLATVFALIGRRPIVLHNAHRRVRRLRKRYAR